MSQHLEENMKKIVDECMGESLAPCVSTCPMHTNVKEYMRLTREHKESQAMKVLRDSLFLPAVLGRVCAHPCETQCKYNEIQNPLAIASIKRYLADNFDDESQWDCKKKPPQTEKIAIIGSGPAGLQAAVDLSKEGYTVEVFEKLPVLGGMMAVGIPEYRLPRNILKKELSYLDKLGVKFHLNSEIGKDISLSQLEKDFHAILFAIGKHGGRIDKSIPHHKAKGIYSASAFLQEVALTRKAKDCGKQVLVLGGGDVAMDCCRVARRLSASVTSSCLEESLEKMPATHHEISGAIAEGISFLPGKGIRSIDVDENNVVSAVTLKHCLSIFDNTGKFAPSYDEENLLTLQVDTIIFAIGQEVDFPLPDPLKNKKNSNIACDPMTLQTPVEKIFACGDASGSSVILIQAMASGRQAAHSILRFLQKQDLSKDRDFSQYQSVKTSLETHVDWTDFSPRLDMKELPPQKRIHSFQEVALGYTKEEAEKESNRCLQCQCRLCMKECIFLNDYTSSPKKLFQEYLHTGYQNMEQMIAFSCNDCSQCKIKCPKDLSLQDSFIAIKEQYITDNQNKQVCDLLKPYDEIQELECSPKYSTTVLPHRKRLKYLFVPGCTVPAYCPEVIEKTLLHLRETLQGDVGAMLQCCGKVTALNGEKEAFQRRNQMAIDEINATNADVIITICPSCFNVYNDTSDKKVISYWDLMRFDIGIPQGQKNIGKNSDVIFNIHDSCVTRDVTSHHESVRWIFDELGYQYEEIHRNKGDTRCCGVGGMVCSSNPELYKRIYTRRATDFSQNHVVTYCGSCRGTMEAAGKDALHILNLLFGETYTKAQQGKRSYKDSDEMWKNRLESKTRLDQLEGFTPKK